MCCTLILVAGHTYTVHGTLYKPGCHVQSSAVRAHFTALLLMLNLCMAQASERLLAVVTFWADRKVFDAEAIAALRHAVAAPSTPGAPSDPTPGLTTPSVGASGAGFPGGAPSGLLPGPAGGTAQYQGQAAGGAQMGAAPYPGHFPPGSAPGTGVYHAGAPAWAAASGGTPANVGQARPCT